MFRRVFFAAAAAALITLLSPADSYAWGAAHVGYTHVGPAGVYHAGATRVATPYGVAGGAHAGAYGYGGGVARTGYGAAYSPYAGAAVGGYRGAAVGGYGGAAVGGVYRRW